MTRLEFIEKWKTKLEGFVFDAITNGRRTEMLATWMRAVQQEIEAEIGRMFDSLNIQPAEPGKLFEPPPRPTPPARVPPAAQKKQPPL